MTLAGHIQKQTSPIAVHMKFGSCSHSCFCSCIMILEIKISTLFIRHDPLNQFCSCVMLFWTNFSILSIHRGVLNEFLTTDGIDALTKHHTTAFITICHHQRKETHLHVFVWRNSGSGPRYLVCASLGLSSPDIWEIRIFPERAFCCTHKFPTAKCRTFPNPSLWTITIAAVVSDLIATWPHKQRSFKIDCNPIPSVAALSTTANSDPPRLKARTPIVLDHAFTNWTLHIATHHSVHFSRGVASSKVCIT